MLEMSFTLVSRRAGIWMQVAVSLAIGLGGMLVCRLMHRTDGKEYFAAMVAIIFYSLFNTVISIAHKSFMRYTVPSYYLYVALMVILLQSAKLLSHISIWDLEEYRMMIISISVFYLIASLAVRAVKYMYEAADSGF